MKRSLTLLSLALGLFALGGCGGKSIEGQQCGNGEMEGNEVCDGTVLDGQDCTDHGFTGGILACSADCQSFDTSQCGDFVCGNDTIEPGEDCEGTDLNGETCQSQGFDSGALACDANCNFDTSACVLPGCGDGAISVPEVCDGTNLGGETCQTQGFSGGTLACLPTCAGFDTSGCGNNNCGNGVQEGTEVCDGSDVGTMTCADFGFSGGTLGCVTDCSDYDRSLCTGAGCGNGTVEPGEVCDLTDVGGLDCTDFGYDAGTLACNMTCDGFDESGCYNASCGDGTADAGEDCDGADLAGQDCVSIAQGFMGGTLACDSSCAFDTTGCIAAPVPGDTCANPGVLPAGSLPVTVSGTTAGQNNDYQTGPFDCPGMDNNEGEQSADVVYEFTPTADGTYVFTFTPQGWDGSIYIVTDCAAIGTTCVEGSEDGDNPADVEVMGTYLTNGTTYYVIIDGGFPGQEGAFTLGVSGPCTPSCAGMQCGSDGCGGSCGTCTGGDVCDSSFQCVDPATLPGNDCGNPIVVGSVPYTDQGSTTGHTDDYEGDAACPGMDQVEGETSADVVYEFTPTVTGSYRIEYIPTFDGAVYVVTDCGDIPGTCVGGSEEASFNPPWNEIVDATLMAGTTYYIIVDGGTNNPGGVDGDYTLSISPPCTPDCTGKTCGPNGCGGSCGTCGGGDVCDDIQGLCLDPNQVPGEDCSNPVVVDPAALPFVYNEDTTGSTNDAQHSGGVCPGEGGGHGFNAGDHTFEFSPSVTGVYEITLTTPTWDGAVYVVTDCSFIDTTCVYSEEDAGPGVETMQITMDATTTYYIIVDGAGGSGDEGPYQLVISQPCIPSCAGLQCGDDGCGGSCGTCNAGEFCDPAQQCAPTPGNLCTNAIPVPQSPFTDSGDTSVATNDYESDAACPGMNQTEGEGSPDIVYAFTPATTGTYQIDYNPTFDGAVYVVTDCGDIPGTCIGGSEDASFNPPWNEIVSANLTAGTTYYIIVDGGIPGGVAGPYTLDITGP